MDMTYEQKKLTSQVLIAVLIVGFVITQIWERTITLEQIALLAGIFLGVLAKFSIPYVLKTHEGTMTPFDVRYVWTGLITFVYMIPIGLLLSEQLALIAPPTFAIVFLGVVLGIGSNWTTEKVVQVAIILKGMYGAYGLPALVGLVEEEIEPVEEPVIPVEPEDGVAIEGDTIIKGDLRVEDNEEPPDGIRTP